MEVVARGPSEKFNAFFAVKGRILISAFQFQSYEPSKEVPNEIILDNDRINYLVVECGLCCSIVQECVESGHQ